MNTQTSQVKKKSKSCKNYIEGFSLLDVNSLRNKEQSKVKNTIGYSLMMSQLIPFFLLSGEMLGGMSSP